MRFEVEDSKVEAAALGMRVMRARLEADTAEVEAVAQALADLPQDAVVITRSPGNGSSSGILTRAAQLVRRHVVSCTPILYWTRSLTSDAVEMDRGASSLDISIDPPMEQLQGLLMEVFAGYENHYSEDPLFDGRIDVASAYADWATRMLGEGGCEISLFHFEGEAAVVFVTSTRNDVCEIILAGTHPNFRRRGLYREGLGMLCALRGNDGCLRMEISTQANNVEVQRVWARTGFAPDRAVHIQHVWPVTS